MQIANSRVFLDTNILIRFIIQESPEHIRVRDAVQKLLANHNSLWISRQVIREFAAVLSRPQSFVVPVSLSVLVQIIDSLIPQFSIADEDEQVTSNLLVLMRSFSMGGKQIHDANIVATMQVYGISYLFTLNAVDFTRFNPRITLLSPEVIMQG